MNFLSIFAFLFENLNIYSNFYFSFLQAYGYKDYKSLDSALVKNIPFILTYRPCDEIVMPFCDGRRDDFRNRACFSNVASATVLRPQSIRYFYHCDYYCNTDEVKIKLDAVLKYFSRRNINCAITFTVLCREGSRCGNTLLEAVSSLKGKQKGGSVTQCGSGSGASFPAAPPFPDARS